MNLVVTVPKWFWPEWIAEGDAAGEPYSGEEWGFFLGGNKPPIGPGDRLYIVAHNRLRGYAPVTRLGFQAGKWVICREGGGVAVTIDEPIKGFQGFRKVWWQPEQEKPFPEWKTAGVGMNASASAKATARQGSAENANMKEMVQQIESEIAKYRLTFADEVQLQYMLAQIFKVAGIPFEREVVIGPGERLDFLIKPCAGDTGADGASAPSLPGFAVEVKIGGAVEGHLRQMKRYNDHPTVLGTILISTRRYDLPVTLSGKPIAGINIGGNRL